MGNSNSQQLHLQLEGHDKMMFGGLHRERSWIGSLGGHHSFGSHQGHGHLIVPLTDAAIQRKMLRNTENGQILQSEGTISQRRRSMRHPEEGNFALTPNRRTLSDSDLSRKVFDHTPHADTAPQAHSQTQKSVIAISPSKAKIKLRKNKGKAPEPPVNERPEPRDLRDARDSMQRRFVRSNSSLCPRTWEHEFNSLNAAPEANRSYRADSRGTDGRESYSRCSVSNVDMGGPRIAGCGSGGGGGGGGGSAHKMTSNRLTRPEAGLLRRSPHDKQSSGSTKSTTSLAAQRPSSTSTSTKTSAAATNRVPSSKAKAEPPIAKGGSNKRSNCNNNNNSCSNNSSSARCTNRHGSSSNGRRDISDTPKPAPVKPQFYFCNMDALKKETNKSNPSATSQEKASASKAINVSAHPSNARTGTPSKDAGKPVARPSSKQVTKEAIAALPSAHDARPALPPARGEVSRATPQMAVRGSVIVAGSSSLLPIIAEDNKGALQAGQVKRGQDPATTTDVPNDDGRREHSYKGQPNPIRQLVVESARSSTSSRTNGSVASSSSSNSTGGKHRPCPQPQAALSVSDNVVFKVNPNLRSLAVPSAADQHHANGGLHTSSRGQDKGSANKPNANSMPQTATQILDELDATLDNYSQLSVGRKSDDSDYYEPDERNMASPRPVAPCPPQPTAAAAAAAAAFTSVPGSQPAADTCSPSTRIPPPKSLEMLFRPPSPKEPKLLPASQFSVLGDVSTNLGIPTSSLPVADKPPTPPPIPASWIKTNSLARRASISSSSSSSSCEDDPCNGVLLGTEQDDMHISVHIRPCLPRRPIGLMPGLTPSRFSPTHAWKSLDPAGSDGDRHSEGHKSLSDCELNFSSSSSSDEERKEETPLKAHLSVDSGITSGYSNPHPHWTPKEDLIDTDTESTGATEPADISGCLFSLPNQARFTLPSMFLAQNPSGGIDSNWSFRSGPNSLQQKSQSVVYLPPPKGNNDSTTVQVRSPATCGDISGGGNGGGESHRRLPVTGRSDNLPSLAMGGSAAGATLLSLNVDVTQPGRREEARFTTDDPLLEAERLREKEQKWMQKVEEEFRKRRERDRQQLREQIEQLRQLELMNSFPVGFEGLEATAVRPDPEGGCDQLQVR